MSRRSGFFSLFFVVAIFLFQAQALGEVRQLTDNDYPDLQPQIHKGQIVWEGEDANPPHAMSRIYYWKNSGPPEVLGYGDYSWSCGPRIHDGKVVWGDQYDEEWHEGLPYPPPLNSVTLFWDGETVTEFSAAYYPGNVSNRIHDGQLLWTGITSSSSNVYYWDGDEIRRLNEEDHEVSYLGGIHKGKAVWSSYNGETYIVFYWNGRTVEPLSPSDSYCSYPEIHDNKIVFMCDDGNDWEIWYWDGDADAPKQLTDNGEDDKYPKIHNGQVVWEGFDGKDFEICYWDGRQTGRITDNKHDDYAHQIHDGDVVWVGGKGDEREIYLLKNARTNSRFGRGQGLRRSIRNLSHNDFADMSPQIHNGQVVWAGSDGHDWEIFFYNGCDLPFGHPDYCKDSKCGPCGIGEGDCDSDLECQEGLNCEQDVGGSYGMPWWYDFCEAPDTD